MTGKVDSSIQPYVSENKNFNQWKKLPDAAVQRIFSFLPLEEALKGKFICKDWCWSISIPSSDSLFIDVRTVPEIAMREYLSPKYAKSAYRQLRNIFNLIGGRDKYYALPRFDEVNWPCNSYVLLEPGDLPEPVVQAKGKEGELFVMFRHVDRCPESIVRDNIYMLYSHFLITYA